MLNLRQAFISMRYLAGSVAVSMALALVCFAQQTAPEQKGQQQLKEYPSGRIDVLVREWSRARDYTMEYINAMPEDGMSFKPTPEIRTFAEQMLHLASNIFNTAARTFGVENPIQGKNLEKMDELKNKADLAKTVRDSYDFMINTIKAQTDARLDERVSFAGMNRPKSALLAASFEHQTHHRGQTTIYLRLKGVTPPGEKLY